MEEGGGNRERDTFEHRAPPPRTLEGGQDSGQSGVCWRELKWPLGGGLQGVSSTHPSARRVTAPTLEVYSWRNGQSPGLRDTK